MNHIRFFIFVINPLSHWFKLSHENIIYNRYAKELTNVQFDIYEFSVDKYFFQKCNDPAISAYVREPPNIFKEETENVITV